MNVIQYKTNKVSKKRVYYTGSDTLLEGYLLCYDYDTTTDLDGDTIAEGSCNSGRYLKVEKPTTNNCPFFAGIVAAESANKVGPCWVTIIEPANVIVPVYTDVNCTNASSYLYVANASYYARATGVVVIGLANETVNRSGTNGLVLCRIKLKQEGTSATVSDSLLSVEVYLKASIGSDETVHSDAIAVLSGRAYSIDTMSKSDDAALTSNTLYKLNSDETVHSDAIAVASNATYKINSDMSQIMSDLKSQASNAKTAASNLAVMLSDDVNYSDVSVLASDIRNIVVKNVSDLAAAVSNICVAFSDRFA